jgi:hypothetical protein
MERRRFIHLIGGGLVASATTVSTVGCSSAYPDETVEAWRGPGIALAQDPRRQALAYAILAPNPHNLQPWRVDLRDEGVITLYGDPQRLLKETDPFGRQILIGHGAFIELLVMALTQQKIASEVTLWPNGELSQNLGQWQSEAAQKPIARIQLLPHNSGLIEDPLFAQILRRHTPKVDYDNTKPVSQLTLDQLLANKRPNSKLQVNGTVDQAQLSVLRDLSIASAKIEIETPRTMLESIQLIRVGPTEILQNRDGISINSPFLRTFSALGLFDRTTAPSIGSTGYQQALGRFAGHSQTAMGFVWIRSPSNTRTEQIESGRDYVRLQLQATALGLGVHPMSQALQEFDEMKPHYERIHQLLANASDPSTRPTVQMFCRMGYTKSPVSPSPRRKLKDFET